MLGSSERLGPSRSQSGRECKTKCFKGRGRGKKRITPYCRQYLHAPPCDFVTFWRRRAEKVPAEAFGRRRGSRGCRSRIQHRRQVGGQRTARAARTACAATVGGTAPGGRIGQRRRWRRNGVGQRRFYGTSRRERKGTFPVARIVFHYTSRRPGRSLWAESRFYLFVFFCKS